MLEELRKKLKWLDPFTYVDRFVMPHINPGNSQAVSLAVYVVFAFVFAFIIFNLLGFLLGTKSPLVIVVSSSMEPVLFRGDVVFIAGSDPQNIRAQTTSLGLSVLDSVPLWSYAIPFCTKASGTQVECRYLPNSCPPDFKTSSVHFDGTVVPLNTSGDIIVYNSNTIGEPVIHRAVVKILANDGTYFFTKGDNVCNSKIDMELGINRGAVKANAIEGKALFWIPKIGCVKLWLFDDLFSLIFAGRLPQSFSGIC